MSTLARHTKHLASDPRASVLLTEEPDRGDPLNHPRITLKAGSNSRPISGSAPATCSAIPRRSFTPTSRIRLFSAGDRDVHFNGGSAGLTRWRPRIYSARAKARRRSPGRTAAHRLGRCARGRRVAKLAGYKQSGGQAGGRSGSTRKAWTSPPAGGRRGSSSPRRRTTRQAGKRGWRRLWKVRDARLGQRASNARADRRCVTQGCMPPSQSSNIHLGLSIFSTTRTISYAPSE